VHPNAACEGDHRLQVMQYGGWSAGEATSRRGSSDCSLGERGGFGGAIGRRRAGVPTRDHQPNQGDADARDHQSRDLRLIA
jgi:hypothetical protein